MAEPSFNDLALFAERQMLRGITIAQLGLAASVVLTGVLALTPAHKAWFLLPISLSAGAAFMSLKYEAQSQSAKRGIAEKIGIEITRRKLEGQL
jgi:hypothetical protein